MDNKIKRKQQLRIKRKKRVRQKVNGTPARPRLSIFKSARHVYAQVIDDTVGQTLVSASSFEKGNHRSSANAEVCAEIGKLLASRCKEKSIEKIVFDKNGFQYHGRVKAFADGAREGGLVF